MNEGLSLPIGWVWTTLGGISSRPQYGWTTKAITGDGSVRLLRTTDISKGCIDWDAVPFCTEIPENLAEYLLDAGDIVISRAGSVGVSYLLQQVPVQSVFASYLIRFRPQDCVDAKYVSYYLHTPAYWARIHEESAGIALANVNARKLEAIEIPLAPLAEQRRIVEAIEQQFTRLDAGVVALKRAQTALKRYRAAVLKAAVEGKLTAAWREEHPNVEPASDLLQHILDERRAKWEADVRAKGKDPVKTRYIAPEAPDSAGMPQVPPTWTYVAAELIADVVDPHPSHRTPAEVTHGIPYVGMGDITADGHFNRRMARKVSPSVLEEHRQRYRLKRGDFIFGKIGTLGKPVKVAEPFDYVLSANVVLIQPEDTMINAGFLHSYMASPVIESLLLRDSRATTQAAFGIQRVRILPVPLPPVDEQQQIVAEVEQRLSIVYELEATVDANLKRADRLRQSILEQAFAGKLVPQDPDNEPASVLLGRIREHREGLSPNGRSSHREAPITAQATLWDEE